jgi:ethanolamine ammonia-lyase small subunit
MDAAFDPPPARMSESDPVVSTPRSEERKTLLEQLRERTPARILTGRAGGAYRTSTWLELRRDHAAARDAVYDEVDLKHELGDEFVAEWRLFTIATRALSRSEFLLRPDFGRTLAAEAHAEIVARCPAGADIQVAIADGLSTAAVRAQVPALLPALAALSSQRGWRFGQPFLIRHGRVGVLNDIGEILDPTIVVLFIGERPGLATAESLSAYMAYRPRAGHDDSRRNLISNIHGRGVPIAEAANRIMWLADQMIRNSTSGVAIKEAQPIDQLDHRV